MSLADEIINGTYNGTKKKKKENEIGLDTNSNISIADSIINGTYEPKIINNSKTDIAPVVETNQNKKKSWISNLLNDAGKIGLNLLESAGAGIAQFGKTTSMRMQEGLNDRADFAIKLQEKTLNKDSKKTDKEKQQIVNKLNQEKEKNVVNVDKYQDIINNLNEEMYKNTQDTSNNVSKKVAELSQSIGNNLVGMGVSAINPGMGTTYFMGSATGSYYDEATSRGMKEDDAKLYAGIMGTMEGLTEKVIAGENIKGIKGILNGTGFKNALKSFGIEVAENFLQEAIMPSISELTTKAVAGNKYLEYDYTSSEGWKELLSNSFSDGIDGALSAIILGGVSRGIASSVNLANKINNGEKISQKEITTAVQDAQKDGINVEEILQEELKKTASNKLNLENNEANQVLQSKNNTQLDNILNNKEISTQNYQYKNSDNEKINNLRQDANKYFNNSEQASNFVNMLEKIITDKNIDIRLDGTLTDNKGNFVNGKYENGVITINPNSTKAGEFIAIHELTHAIGTKEMLNIINTYRNSNTEFDSAVKNLLQNYEETEISEEALSDVSAQLFGNQEFINNIVQNNPNIFQKIYNEIKYLWHQFRGYKNQNQFVEDLYYKWTQAYNSNNKLNETNNYSFAGRNAKTANIKNLVEAVKLEEKGKNAQEIYEKTGWYRGNESKWRFEIADNNFNIKNGTIKKDGWYRLNEILDAPELYNAYPELEKTEIYFEDLDKNKNAYAIPEKNRIYINNELIRENDSAKSNKMLGLKNQNEIYSILTHEIQHIIQQKEEFSRGSSEEYWYRKQKQDATEYAESLPAFEKLKTATEKAEFVENFVKNNVDKYTIYSNYRNTAGEQEARNAQERINMKDEYRKRKMPFIKNEETVYAQKSEKNYHISENFSNEIDKSLRGEIPSNNQIKARDYTPKILVENGVKDLPMLLTQKHLKQIIYTQQEAIDLKYKISEKDHYHGLGKETLLKAIDNLDNPKEIYKQSESNYLIITEITDKYNNKIIVPIKIKGKGTYNDMIIDENQIASVYGHKNLENYLNKNNFEKIYEKNRDTLNEGVISHNISNSTNSIPPKKTDVNTTTKYSIQESENNSGFFNWQEYLENNFKQNGTTTNLKEIAPIRPDITKKDENIAPEITPPNNTPPNNNTENEKIAEILSERPKQENRKQRVLAKMKAAFLDKGAVFEDLSIKTKNRDLMGKWDYILTSEARAQNAMLNGIGEIDALNNKTTMESKSLYDIWEPIETADKVKDFSEYLYHKHNIDRMSIESKAQEKIQEIKDKYENQYTDEEIKQIANKRITDKTNETSANMIKDFKELQELLKVKNKPVFSNSITSDISQDIVNKYENTNPEFIEWSKDIYDYNKALLNLLVKSGVESKDTANYFNEKYPNYVPITRAKNNSNVIDVPLDSKRTGINTPIKRAKGGNSDIIPLKDTMAQRTLQTYKAIAKNNFGIELKNALNSVVDNQITNIEEVLDNVEQQDNLLVEGKNNKNPTFTVFENGEKVTYEITNDMYDALKPVSDSSILNEKLLKGIPGKISSFHRGVLTEYNPVFMLTNAIKDAQDVLINSQHPAKTYSKLGESYAQIINEGYWYQEYIQNGGEQNSYFNNQDGTFNIEKKGIEKVLDVFPLRTISEINNIIEMSPRLAEYIASREQGRSIETSMLDASRVTTNFKAGGDVTKFLNRNGATFLNASVQGMMQQVRNIKEANMNGLKGYANLATKFAIAGIPGLILNSLLWGDDDDYEQLSDYVKQNYWIVGKYGDGNFIRIPKGRMITVIQEGLNQMKNLVTGNDEADLGEFLQIVSDNIAPNNPIENNVIAPFFQAASNKTWYGGDLVPSRLQNVPKAQQYDETTDSFSKWLGEKLNISPYKINYILDQYSGGIGDVVLPMMTEKAETGNDGFGSKLLAPLTNKFSVDSVMKNQNMGNLYDLSDKLTINANDLNATDEDILKKKYIDSAKGDLNKLYQEERKIQNDTTLKDSEKYKKVREIQKQINSMAKEATDNYEKIKTYTNYAKVNNNEYYKDNEGQWKEIKEKELKELNELNMSQESKNIYFSAKNSISNMVNNYNEEKGNIAIDDEDSDKYKDAVQSLSKEKKKAVINKIINTKLSDNEKAYLYKKYYNSDTVDIMVQTGIKVNDYLKYTIQDIEADYNSNGKAIRGSKKNKVVKYVNSLSMNVAQKAILIKSTNSFKFNDYNNEIVSYVKSLNNVSYKDKKKILEDLDMTVSSNGTVSWKK